MKKIHILMLSVLLVFQTLLAPLSVLAEGEPVPVTTGEPTDESTGGPTDGPIGGPTDESIGGPTDESIGGPTDESIGESTEEPIGGPTEESTEESTDETDVDDKESEGEGDPKPNKTEIDRKDEKFTEKITLQINDKEMPNTDGVKSGDAVKFKVEMSLQPGHDYGKGTTLSYNLPEQFAGLQVNSSFIFDQGTEIATVAVNGQTVVITFTDAIRADAGEAGTTGTVVDDVFFEATATLKAVGNDWKQNVEVPGFDTITLNFEPTVSGPSLSKSGVADKNGENSEFITWTVDVTPVAGVTEFTDVLEGPHSFTEEAPNITKSTFGPNGEVIKGPESITVNPTFDDKKQMTLQLPEESNVKYTIVYKTKVGDPGNVEEATFKNAAMYAGKPAKDEVGVKFGTPLSKEASSPNANLETTWTIKYNHNQRLIKKAEAILVDEWTAGHVLVGDVTVEGSNALYKVDKSSNGLTISFNEDINDAYTITYKTKPKDIYPKDGLTVSNTVKREDIKDNSKTASAIYGKTTFVLDKEAKGVNYAAKTKDWTITANQAGYELARGTTFIDTYEGSLLTVKGTPTVTVGGKSFTNFDFKRTKDGKDKETGFTIALNEEVNEKIVISYTTDYDIKDTGSNTRTYENKVMLTNTGIDGLNDATDSAVQHIEEKQKNNGEKTGYYNYETKTFHWDVEVNFNYNTLENAKFVDVLPNTQKVTSMQVQPGKLNANGTFEAEGKAQDIDVSTFGNKITHELGQITGPYKITYTSVDADGVYPHGQGKLAVTNTAKLLDGETENASWTKTVEVEHTEKILDKGFNQEGSSPKVNWNFKFNYAQSDLKNISITDTVGKLADGEPGQLILQDSFKVYEVKFNGTDSKSSQKKEISNPDITVDLANGTFNLKLPDGDKAYYVEYSTIFMGPTKSKLENIVNVSYISAEGSKGSDTFSKANFTHDAGGKVGTVPFVILKTDAATGEPMEAEFALYGPYTGNTKLVTGTTDNKGYLNYGMKLSPSADATKKYKVVETKLNGYQDLTHEFVLDRDKIETTGQYKGYQVIEIQNIPESGLKCEKFEMVVKDVDGKLYTGNIIIKNKVTATEKEYGVTNGKITFKRSENIEGAEAILTSGEYEVTFENTTTPVTVDYNGNCAAEIAPKPSCPNFTITLNEKNEKDENIPRKKVTVALAKKDGNGGKGEVVATGKTDDEGKFTIPSTTPADTYYLYEGNQFLGEVKVSYKDGCEAVVVQSPTCEHFTLVVNNINGEPVADDKEVIIKKGDTEIEKLSTKDGKVTLTDPLAPGVYTATVDGKIYPSFTTDTTCQHVIQPKVADKCPKFEIKVEDPKNVLKTPVSKLVLKNGDQTFEIAKDKEGKFVVDTETTTMPAGTYNVYDGNLFLGTVTVDYEKGCEATLTINETPTCPAFTLTIKDMYGNARKDVTVTLTDEADALVVVNGDTNFTTDANGQIEIKTDVIKAGKYTVKEGTKALGTITVGNTCEATIQPPRPTPPTPTGPKCDDYTVTVQGLGEGENTPRPGVEVQMKNAAGTIVATGTTDKDGKIVFPRKDFAKGEYTIYIDGAHIKVITITDDDCDVTVAYKQPEISCPNVTVTVKDEAGKARPNVDVMIKDSEGKVVTTSKTNEKGEIKTDEPLTPGKYEVYEGDTKIGEFTKDETTCEYTVQPGKEISCPRFELTVIKGNKKPDKLVYVSIKDAEGNAVEVDGKTELLTDNDGKVIITKPLPAGTYKVYKGKKAIGTIKVDGTNCEATVQSSTSGGGGGGGGSEPEKPTTPGEDKPTEPGKPTTPGEDKPTEPGKPGEGKPTEPSDPNGGTTTTPGNPNSGATNP